MRVIGIAATAALSTLAAAALVVGVRSIPDIQRYLNMRRM